MPVATTIGTSGTCRIPATSTRISTAPKNNSIAVPATRSRVKP